MALSKFVADEAYKNLLRDAKLETCSYEDVARDWEENSREWFHALIAIEDLPIVLAIPDLKIYAWCRCKVVADDGSEAHFTGMRSFTSPSARETVGEDELLVSALDLHRERTRLRKSSVLITLLEFSAT